MIRISAGSEPSFIKCSDHCPDGPIGFGGNEISVQLRRKLVKLKWTSPRSRLRRLVTVFADLLSRFKVFLRQREIGRIEWVSGFAHKRLITFAHIFSPLRSV